jgi:hypothetical protein
MESVLVAIPPDLDVKNGALLDASISMNQGLSGFLISVFAETFAGESAVAMFQAPGSPGPRQYVVPISPGLLAITDAKWHEVRLRATLSDIKGEPLVNGPGLLIESVQLGNSGNLIQAGQ